MIPASNYLFMKTSRKKLLIPTAVLLAGSSFFFTGCPDTPEDKPADSKDEKTIAAPAVKLEEVDGALIAYSIRHPKLIIGDLNKMMQEIPEASIMQIFLSQFVAFGYPEFTEIETGSKIGAFLIDLPFDELKASNSAPIVFCAKLKENGKIWKQIEKMGNVFIKKHNDWVFFAENEKMLGKVKNLDAYINFLQREQSEEFYAWINVKPSLIDDVRVEIDKEINGIDTNESFTPEMRNAAKEYLRVLAEQIKSLHSINYSADLQDTGAQIKYAFQFKPDSEYGKWALQPSNQDVKAAQSVSADALITFLSRSNPKATEVLVNHILNAFAQVNYAPVSNGIKDYQKAIEPWLKASDGSYFGNMDFQLDLKNEKKPVDVKTFFVYTGKYSEESVRPYWEQSIKLGNQLVSFILKKVTEDSDSTINMEYTYTTNAFSLEGITFDLLGFNMTTDEETISEPIYYAGVKNGNMILGSNEEMLRKNLPPFIANEKIDNSIYKLNALKENEMMNMAVNGANVVSLITQAMDLGEDDTDIKAALEEFQNNYKLAGPVTLTSSLAQAKADVTITVPYKFVANSIRFGQYLFSSKVNFLFGNGYDNGYDDDSYDYEDEGNGDDVYIESDYDDESDDSDVDYYEEEDAVEPDHSDEVAPAI